MNKLNFAYIGQRIREVRNEKKLKKDWLAEKIGFNVSHISNIEMNKVKVSLVLFVQSVIL